MTLHDQRRVEWVREDVHIHAPGPEVYRRLANVHEYSRWLARHFRDFTTTDDDGIAFSLALPLRTEPVRLRRDRSDADVLAFVGDGDSAVTAITWAFHQEGPREVHLTVEARYHPAGGVIGTLLEVLLHRPQRTQALRESLWNFKQIVESER